MGPMASLRSWAAGRLRLQHSVHVRKQTPMARSLPLLGALGMLALLLLRPGSYLPAFLAGCFPGLLHGRGRWPRQARLPRWVVCASPRSETDGGGQWRAEEDWALLDETPSFTVGAGANTVTFWSALASTSTVLCQRTSSELEQRMAELAANESLPQSSYGSEPSVITGWARLPDGRFTGSVDGRAVWLTAELEGRLASDPRSGAGYVVSLGGRVYELGESRASLDGAADVGRGRQPAAPDTHTPESADAPQFDLMGIAASAWQLISGSMQVIGIAVVAGGIGLVVGLSAVPPKVTYVSLKAPSPPATQKALPARAASQQREQVQLLLSEQRARQQIQVDMERNDISSLESRLKLDQDNIKAKVAAEEARLQANRERQVILDKEKTSALETRLRAEVQRGKNKLSGLELKLRQDQEQLTELQRAEAERGPGAAAIQLSVAPSGGGTPVKEGPQTKAGVAP